ncbi:MAG TPA: glycosyltransferase family 4 protein [Rhodanobacteraceae bacterium]
MRIAFLCKRRYMGKDVIDDRYGRLYEIPRQLAMLGHDVRGFCLAYQGQADGIWEHDALPGRLRWQSRSLGRTRLPVLLTYSHELRKALQAFAPDIVIAASDIPHIVLGKRLANRLGVPFVADLYDNFEGFGQARIPGMVTALRRAVRRADLTTTTSQPLANYVRDHYHVRGQVVAMPSTIDKAVFHQRDKAACRAALGLPQDAVLVGTAGGLLESRGIGTLYTAWPIIADQHDNIHLVLAGPTDGHCPPPTGMRVHYLGMLSHAHVAKLFGALDVGVIYLRDTPFGRFCFPQKAYEMMACGLPFIATAVGVMPHLLAARRACLYREDDVEALVKALATCLASPNLHANVVTDWASVIGLLEKQLIALDKPISRDDA